ncbi:hypothetical protein [Prosthecomicrobium hirschii]|uniref:hypothetical protein n=1 Tax=Prosthecodimorpha hirschii TaxID=665126 RepID=UPI00221FDC0D|nr:hypothetical protein [Prosthecomicrobium hirschii]MCW1841398.1 hypothetical protein [Prosthecomicrobium hirschii]
MAWDGSELDEILEAMPLPPDSEGFNAARCSSRLCADFCRAVWDSLDETSKRVVTISDLMWTCGGAEGLRGAALKYVGDLVNDDLSKRKFDDFDNSLHSLLMGTLSRRGRLSDYEIEYLSFMAHQIGVPKAKILEIVKKNVIAFNYKDVLMYS